MNANMNDFTYSGTTGKPVTGAGLTSDQKSAGWNSLFGPGTQDSVPTDEDEAAAEAAEMPVDEPVDVPAAGEVDDMPVDDMPVDDMPVDDMPVDDMPVDDHVDGGNEGPLDTRIRGMIHSDLGRNKAIGLFSFGPLDISPDPSIHQVESSKIRSDLEDDTDKQCHSANCHERKKSQPPKGKVCCYICGYPCFQRGGTMYDTFSVQCEHVLPVAVLSLLSGLADGSRGDNKFNIDLNKVKKTLGINTPTISKYDEWRGGIIGAVAGPCLREGGGVSGSAYQWAHPVCNMIKSNHPFITICYSKYGFFFVSDALEILLPPDHENDFTVQQTTEITGLVGPNARIHKCESIDEYHEKSISTQNLVWLFKTVLGMTGEWGSYSDQWKNAILLRNAVNEKGKGTDWSDVSATGKNKYQQLLEEDTGIATGFEAQDPIFSQAFGRMAGTTLQLSLFEDGVKKDYLPYDEWIEKRVQKIKGNILLPLLKKICSQQRYAAPVYGISAMETDSIPDLSLFSMISTTTTGSRICHNMVKLKKSFFQVSKDERAQKLNIIWFSIIFEDLLEMSAGVVKDKGKSLGLNFDTKLSQTMRKLAKSPQGLATVLKNVMTKPNLKAKAKAAKAKAEAAKEKVVKKLTSAKPSKKARKVGGSIEMGLQRAAPSFGYEPDFKGMELGTPRQTTPRQTTPLQTFHKEAREIGLNINLNIEIQEMVFGDPDLLINMEKKLIHYLDEELYPTFLEVYEDLEYTTEGLTKALSEYDGDPCLYSSLPEILMSNEGLNLDEIGNLFEYDSLSTQVPEDNQKYTDWWTYLDQMVDEESPGMKRGRAGRTKRRRRRKTTKKKSRRTKTNRKITKRKKSKRKKTKKKRDLVDEIISRLGYKL